MILLTLITAIGLSGIAAYYSIIGLASIFPGAFWPVVAMGGALEVAKLVTASWLYRNWKITPLLLRTYLSTAVFLLMLITSMGIFGFLSKSHIDTTLVTGVNTVEIQTITTQETIARDRLVYLLARSKDPSTASNRLDRQIQDTQKELTALTNRKLPLLVEENKLTVEIGPIKYVAELIYGTEAGGIDRAVRLVIMIIMVVFDPLAVLLLIAANISIKERENEGNVPALDKTKVENEKDLLRPAGSQIQIDTSNLATIGEVPKPKNKTPKKKIMPKYDYNEQFSFKEKK